MRNLLLATVSAAALTASTAAFASDPTPGISLDWRGFYLGGHAGYGWSHFDAQGGDSDVDGVAAGLLLGYNVQMRNFVLGIEADWTATPWTSSVVSVTPKSAAQGRYTGMASVRGRLGYVFDRTMVFGTAGFGVVEGSYSDTKNKVISDFSHSGTVLGGGIEYKLTKNVNVGVDAMHYMVSGSDTRVSPSAKKSATFGTDDITVVRARLSVQF